MAIPALAYLVATGGDEASGWGVPMATDIAFALGVLALLGHRAPARLKVFLLTLAVADDIGAIAVIALFYSGGLAWRWLLLAVAILVAVVALQRVGVRHLFVYVFAAAGLWLAVFESGVHATVAGVALGLLTPARPLNEPRAVAHEAAAHLTGVQADAVADEDDESSMRHVGGLVDEAVSPLARLQHSLHPWTAFVILPIFALANAGIDLGARSFSDAASDPVTRGVFVGLVVGKPLGILGAAGLAVGVLHLALPDGIGWRHLVGVGLLAGIGFTVSIFIAGLAFDTSEGQEAAKLGVLVASVVAGAAGAAVLAARRLPSAAGATSGRAAAPRPPRRRRGR
jgi:NhaA family Na+:H+ antiporter